VSGQADPDVLLLAPCGSDAERARREAGRLVASQAEVSVDVRGEERGRCACVHHRFLHYEQQNDVWSLRVFLRAACSEKKRSG
jgi:hypothetical protein